jgi:hypothetical protein
MPDLSYAVVAGDGNGTLLHSRNVSGVRRIAKGQYLVAFTIPTIVQVVSLAGNLAQGLTATAYGGSDGAGPNEIFVGTYGIDGAGGQEGYDFNFQLLAYSNAGDPGAPGLSYAVVGRDGSLLHGINVSGVRHLRTGEYLVSFTVPTTAQIVSLGDPVAAGTQPWAVSKTTAYGGLPGSSPNDVFVGVFTLEATVFEGLRQVGVDATFQLIAF